MADLLALLDTLDGLHKAATEGGWFVAQGLGGSQLDSVRGGERGRNVVAFGTRSREDAASIAALHNAYPHLAQALRAALTPTTDGEREAREALAKFDEPRCGRSLDWVIPGLRCNNVEGHAGSCSHDSRRDVRERATVVTPDHLRTTLALLAAERAKAAALSAEIAELRDPDARYRALLDWRGVETPCPTCSGSGRRGYGNTSTWRRGSGGCAITDDVCDACWGTGDAERKGADLRAKAADAARERAAIVAMLRKRAEDFANRNSGAMTDSPSTVLDDAADAIERGAHTKVTP